MSRSLKLIFASLTFIVISLAAALPAQADSIVLFNTGVTAPGTPAPGGSADTHYTITASPTGASAAIVASSIPGSYIPNDSNSQWISISANTDGPVGDYTYRTTFNLTGLNPATAVITGRWATDNAGLDILINGISTGNTNTTQFGSFTSFSINSGFIAGVNTLDFIVNNGGGPTGLRVDQLQGTASPPQASGVPEPTTMILLGTGLAGVVAKVRKRHKAQDADVEHS